MITYDNVYGHGWKVQNSTWKINPQHPGATFYVENCPSESRCKIIRGKTTLFTIHLLHLMHGDILSISLSHAITTKFLIPSSQ